MVFSSIPPPPNWQQQPFHQANDGNSAATENNQNNFSHLVAPSAQHPPRADQGSSFIRSLPGGMADRARLAKVLPQTQDLQVLVAQKCPRCDSANTKFCYFNNYSLTQPRHFCKTCRRYWTRGGALRNVPVGGGCRRNKRSSKASSRSKSPATSAAGGSSTTSSATFNNNNNNNGDLNGDLNGNLVPLGQQSQLGFFNSVHNFSNFGTAENVGLNFGEMGFLGGGGGFGNARLGIDQWRVMPQPSQMQQQIHFVGGNLEQQALDFANLGGVKNEQGLNILSRNFMDVVQGNHDHDDDQYWGGGSNANNNNNGATWNNAHHLSGFNTSSTTGHHF